MSSTDPAADLDFRQVLDGLDEGFMIMDRRLHIVYANPAYLAATNTVLDEIQGEYMFDVFPEAPEKVASVREIFLNTLNCEITTLDNQAFALTAADGSTTHHVWRAVQTPYVGADGSVSHIVQRSADVTEAVETSGRADIIAKEFEHRMKNMFAVVIAMAEISGKEADTVDEYKSVFTARLMAMSRTHDKLVANDWRGLNMRNIIEDELAHYPRDRIGIEGPPLPLRRRITQNASMLMHEMASNAAKHGCFSIPEGTLLVKWEIDEDSDELILDWIESGSTGIKPPDYKGFGSILIDMLDTLTVEREWRPEGLKARFRMPAVIIDQRG